MIFMFDVDGTLTPSRGRMDKDFSLWFSSFCHDHDVYVVTGSDRPKTEEQLGKDIYSKLKGAYQCSGNDHWIGDKRIRTSKFEDLPGDELWKALNVELSVSKFYIRTGCHIEIRPGLLNFSIVGRNANDQQRKDYVEYDEIHNERNIIAEHLRNRFTDYNFQVAGETGIDIVKKGGGKEQVLTDFDKDAIIHFYGDKTFPGGNDHEIAMEVRARGNDAVQVDDWRHTWKLLKEKCKQ